MGFSIMLSLKCSLSQPTALPTLQYLKLVPLKDIEDVYQIAYEHQDWSCLSRIDLPNLTELHIGVGFNKISGIVKPTANLPKLEKLQVDRWVKTRHPREWAEYAEEMFSSPLLQQLVELGVPNSHFRLDSLAVLCKYAMQLKNLVSLEVHCYDLEGVRMIGDAGKAGGFPILKNIAVSDVRRDCLIDLKGFQTELKSCLTAVWPKIETERDHNSISFISNEDSVAYGQPNEFGQLEADQVEEDLEELQIHDE